MEHAIIQEIRETLKTAMDWPIGKTESPLKLNTTRFLNEKSLASIDSAYRRKANQAIANYLTPPRTVSNKSLDDLFSPILDTVIGNIEKTLRQYRANKSDAEILIGPTKTTHHFIKLYSLLKNLENPTVTEFHVTSEIPKTLIISGEIEDDGLITLMISASISD
ncbi:MAG: hypothetical protein ACRC6M_02380 [Microcystaceae cyanobacterium]